MNKFVALCRKVVQPVHRSTADVMTAQLEQLQIELRAAHEPPRHSVKRLAVSLRSAHLRSKRTQR
jgi:hypothetical protein